MLVNKQVVQVPDIKTLIFFWQQTIKNLNWENLIKETTPKNVGCGLVYELNTIKGLGAESFAIADMRHIACAEPHYHDNNETEIYFVLQGSALVVITDQELHVTTGDVIVIEPYKAHFTIPDKNFIIAAVNTPPFNPQNYIPLSETNHSVGFDLEKFNQIIMQNTHANRGINHE
ncbi:cupin domain-containing protein [bacterium]|nr:MAG: cupin domain-containing protein [bacterium]